MKNVLSVLVAVVGVVCIVFGVLFILQAQDGRATLVDELAASNITLDTLNTAYDQANTGLGLAMQSGDDEKIQDAGWQKASLAVAKSNAGVVDFAQNSGILMIVIGAGLIFAGWGLMIKS
jgi:hypothetical protein